MKLYILPPSPNSMKVIAANAILGTGAEVVPINAQEGLHKRPEFLAKNPNGLLPVLELDDGSTLWESNAIVNRLAAEGDTPLWPRSNQRYDIMRWQFWESCHWTPATSKFLSYHLFGDTSIDLEAATETLRRFGAVLDGALQGTGWLSGEAMTVADIVVAAPLVYRASCQMPLDGFDALAGWMARIEALPGWQAAMPRAEAA